MMTNNLAQIAGEPTRQATEGGDETDPEVLAARAAAELPAGFVWGAATSSYQIEGAVAADGRRPCSWDTFAATPGKAWGGEPGGRWYSNLMRAHRSAGGPT